MKEEDHIASDEFLFIYLAMVRVKYIEVIRKHGLAQKITKRMPNSTKREIADAGRDWLFSEGVDSEALQDMPAEDRKIAIDLFGEVMFEELHRVPVSNN